MAYPNLQSTNFQAMQLDASAKADIVEMMDGDPELIIDLIDTMVETTPELMEQLVSGIQTADNTQVRSTAHALKSSAAQFGAKDFSNLCRELEDLGRNQEAAQAKANLPALQQAYEGMKAALDQWKLELQG